VLSSRAIAVAASQAFGLPLLDLDVFDTRFLPQGVVDPRLLRRHQVLPLLRQGSRLSLGVADPTTEDAFNDLKFHTGVTLETVIVEEDKLRRMLAALLDATPEEETSLDDLASLRLETGSDASPASIDEATVDEAPIVRFEFPVA